MPTEFELLRLLRTAQEHNRTASITGILVYDQGRFFQWLEGPKENLEQLWRSIQRDPRHDHIEVLSEHPISMRVFGSSSMRLACRPGEFDNARNGWLEPPTSALDQLATRPQGAAEVLASLASLQSNSRRARQASAEKPTIAVRTVSEAPADIRLRLEQLVSQAVIPRLIAAHAAPILRGRVQSLPVPIHEDAVFDLANLVVGQHFELAWKLISNARVLGTDIESLFFDLMEPAARRLGDMWQDDTCNDIEATLGMSRLQLAARRLGADWAPALIPLDGPHHILVAPQPGEPHMLAATLASEAFRHVGWDVSDQFPTSDNALSSMVHDSWFDALDLTLSGAFRREHRLDVMAATIRAVRAASLNPALVVIVGGRAFVDRPETGLQIGADASSSTSGDVVAKIIGAMALRSTVRTR